MFPRTRRPLLAALAALAVVAGLSGAASCDALRRKSSLEELATTQLSTETAPWYIIHGILVGGPELTLRDSGSGAVVDAVDYLTTERQIKDRTGRLISSPYREDELPRFPRTDGQFVGQGHPNQFLATLTGVGIPLSHPVVLQGGGSFTLADALESAKLNLRASQILVVPPEAEFEDHELGWSIGLIADTLGTDAKWQNKWGEDVSLEGLVEIAVQRPLGWGSCGGTHELSGLARALRAHRAKHQDLSGVWQRVARYLDDGKARARASQHEDGSFDYEWAQPQPREAQTELVLNRKVHITGHMLEWLALASSPEEIGAPYLQKAYAFLESARFREVALEPGRRGTSIVGYGSVTHAVRGMNLYRQKLAAAHTGAVNDKTPG